MKKKFRRIIKNANPKMSVVQKFNEGDMKTPIQEITYGLPPLTALTYYYMQFILQDYMYEKYPRYIVGTLKSSKVKDVFYYDKLEGVVLRSSPSTNGEKWRFHCKPKKSVLPPRREKQKRLVLKEVNSHAVTITSTEIDTGNRQFRPADLSINREVRSVEQHKELVFNIRKGVSLARKRKIKRIDAGSVEREPEIKVVAECSRRPKLKRK